MLKVIPYIFIPTYNILFCSVLFLNIATTILIRNLEIRGLSADLPSNILSITFLHLEIKRKDKPLLSKLTLKFYPVKLTAFRKSFKKTRSIRLLREIVESRGQSVRHNVKCVRQHVRRLLLRHSNISPNN
jgi:hypothetical protein